MASKKILFQGDSITDCVRNRFSAKSLGLGYCSMVAEYMEGHFGEKQFRIINKGIFGNTTTKLKKRWWKDTLWAAPDVLSLLIGINDTWRRYDRGVETSIELFEQNYEYLLQSIIKRNKNVKIILMSPFLIPLNEEQDAWFEDLRPKIAVVEALAEKYGAVYIPLQEKFNAVLAQGKSAEELTADGVHPTHIGHKLIAAEWIKSTKDLLSEVL